MAISPEKRQEYQARYKQRHPDRVREQFRKWREKNKEHLKEYRAIHREERNAATKRWQAAHPEQTRAIYRKWCSEHKEERRAYQRKHIQKMHDHYRMKSQERYRANPDLYKRINRKSELKRFYGLTPEQYNAIISRQGGACAICEKEKELNVDHIHGTRNVRGLLCRGCNCGLGNFGDSVELMQRAIVYLKG